MRAVEEPPRVPETTKELRAAPGSIKPDFIPWRKGVLTRSGPTLALVLTSSVSTKSTLFRTVYWENSRS